MNHKEIQDIKDKIVDLDFNQFQLMEWVKKKHGSQVRKYTSEPYYYHVMGVAAIVSAHVTGAIETALCHDLLEDTDCTEQELKDKLKEIGYDAANTLHIVNGIKWLTDEFTHEKYPDWNRKERKRQEVQRLRGASGFIHSIKYADMIDNAKSIVEHDPGFARKYLEEMVFLLDQCRLGNIELYMRACRTVLEGREKLGSLINQE